MTRKSIELWFLVNKTVTLLAFDETRTKKVNVCSKRKNKKSRYSMESKPATFVSRGKRGRNAKFAGKWDIFYQYQET